MEETTTSPLQEGPSTFPQITSESTTYLLKAAKWGKFLSILGFIMSGLLFVAGIVMGLVINSLTGDLAPMNMPLPPAVFSLIYILIAIIYVIPVIFLNKFSNHAIKAVQNSNTDNMTISLRNLKNLFVFVGIATIVLLAIYTIALITVGLAAIFSF